MYRLTSEISRRMTLHAEAGDLDRMPPILAFQSSVDATVSTRALIDSLFSRLSPNGHRLVLFDINRRIGIEPLLKTDPADTFADVLQQKNRPYTLSIITRTPGNPEAVMRTRSENQVEARQTDTGIQWPAEVYSLSHIALPFPADDPLYGPQGRSPENAVQLGDFASRGERGVLLVPPGDMLRLRWNPFYPLIEQALLNFTELE